MCISGGKCGEREREREEREREREERESGRETKRDRDRLRYGHKEGKVGLIILTILQVEL